jgi:hypothetical protein
VEGPVQFGAALKRGHSRELGMCMWRTLLPISMALTACGDGNGPSPVQEELGLRLTALGYLWSPLEWSLDSREIYLVAGRFAPEGRRDELLAIDVQTGATRVLAHCAVPEAPLAATVQGVAFLSDCTGNPGLRLVSSGRDTLLAVSAQWMRRTGDRARVIYGDFPTAPCDPCYPIVVIDLATLVSYPVPNIGLPPIHPEPAALAPDGTELLVGPAAAWPTELARLSLTTGAWSEAVRRDWEYQTILGWNANGVWLLVRNAGAQGYQLAEALSGTVAVNLPIDQSVSLSEWTSGSIAPGGSTVALWHRGCVDFDVFDNCISAHYELWSHDLATHGHTLVARGSASVERPGGGDPYWQLFGHEAYSPDGRKLAYLMHGDVYLQTSP